MVDCLLSLIASLQQLQAEQVIVTSKGMQQKRLFPKLLERHILVTVLFHDLSNRHFKVLLSDVYSALPQCKHTSFSTARFHLCT